MGTPSKTMGNTDQLAWCLVRVLIFTIVMSFILAIYSVHEQYLGALACWTACIAPTDTALAIVLKAVVDKNREENTGADGEGIRYRQLVSNLEAEEKPI